MGKKKEEVDFKALYQRALADYQNLERRVESDKADVRRFASAIVILKFLEILDNLEKAQKHLSDPGLDLVIKQFNDILTSEGVAKMDVEGEVFDPHLHEAVEVGEGGKPNTVLEEIGKGYTVGDKVLRVAKVKVSQGNL